LTPERGSRHRIKGQKSLIVDDVVSIDVKVKKKDGYRNPNLLYQKHYFLLETTLIDPDSHNSLAARPARGGETDV
jgi:hypothetical protein